MATAPALPSACRLDNLNESLRKCQERLAGSEAQNGQLNKAVNVSKAGRPACQSVSLHVHEGAPQACVRSGAAGQLPQAPHSPARAPKPHCPRACLPACPCLQAKEQLLAERDAELACTQERVEALEKDVGMKARMLAGISQVGARQAGGWVVQWC